MDDEIMAVAKLKLAHGMIMEFRVDWGKNKLPEVKKNEFVFQDIFSGLT